MTRIQVHAGQSMLESYVKTPSVGLCELIWNSFDEDATDVWITIETNVLEGIERILVEDDGNGMTAENASSAFATVGDSWKRMPGTLSRGKRPVHGRHGRGRYAAFGLGLSIQWRSTAEAIEGGLAGVLVIGSGTDLQHMDVSPTPAEAKSGTVVTIGLLTDEAIAAFDRPGDLKNQILTEFALHLDRFTDFHITFLGEAIDPSLVMESTTEISLELPEGIEGSARLTVIEWKLEDVERRLYLCSADGAIVDELAPGVQAPGAEFTAYLEWDGFNVGDPLTLEGDTETPAGQVIQASREALKAHLAISSRKREAAAVKRWQSEGVYPYAGKPKDAVEGAARSVFNVVAMAASRTLDETKSRSVKALSLSLMKETLESDPESLLPILQKVAKLPSARIDELREILEHTSITQLIQVGKEIGNRVEFLNGLDSILFDRQVKRRLLERRQLHRILAHETWIFGEEWALTGDDQPLAAVLKNFLSKLSGEAELATADLTDPVLRDDGSIAIPDLVLGRSLETREDHSRQLVVELKRPSHKLTPTDVDQLRSYASAITNDERFARPNVTWDFWLVGNETTREVDEMREQTHLPPGVVHSSKAYRILARTWSEVIDDARHRLKFVERSLQYESSRDSGLAYLRSKYSEYLPDVAIEAVVDVSASKATAAAYLTQ
jgi:hypothetical protein